MRAGVGSGSVCAVVEVAPWSRMPEARALVVPRDASTWARHASLTTISPRAGRLNAPRPALVETAVDGSPRLVNREEVTLVREEWRVVDRWWTDEPVDRRYFEVVLESGRNTAVYHDRELQSWFTQRA